jgi:hypothetical protein
MRPTYIEPEFTQAQQDLLELPATLAAIAAFEADPVGAGPLANNIIDAGQARTAREAWQEENDQARGMIFSRLGDSIGEIYDNVENARTLWDTLQARYGDAGRIGVFNEYNNIHNWVLDESVDPETSLNLLYAQFQRIANQGYSLANEQKAMIVLRGLPNRWDQFRSAIFTAGTELRLDRVTIQVQEEWRRRNPARASRGGNAHLARGELQNAGQAPQWQG